ncbi:MAG: hypothetical protein UV80_C0014G0005 [Candidatus Peregrinibacteria bacterium GW2011_GWF2_43_17]|nr:MAG: hypothetical protein UV80_C0014G0005 [Candidatus Peregrinibacteria bacterium GW2011_GWF2_43_17]KKT18594.1 MAG: hypothetical protein UW03_C0037G0015 [Candidatus Peregrinibacteria bacterium GW2011_GWA2_43_8]HAU39369.1 hypothetical protein [Candidatus Peregrinibacteria bacterium]
MKKILALVALLIAFSGCSNEETTPEQGTNPTYYVYSTNSFSLEVPNDWEVISQFTSDYPTNTLVAFRNNIKEQDFLANVNIVGNTVGEISNGDYAIEMLKKHSETLIDYTLLEQKEVEIFVGGQLTPAYRNYFEGRNSPDTNTLKFIQVYAVKDGIGYIATASFLPNEDTFVTDTCVNMVESLEIK